MSADRPRDQSESRRGLVGRMLGGRYRVERLVSSGANTLIVDAHDVELDRAVTVKLVRPEWAEVPEFRRRFRSVMRVVSALSHPNLAAVYDWGEDEVGRRTTVFAVVEKLTGGSLRDLFDRGRYLDPSQALLVGLEACRGLDFAHGHGLVHTEVTPAKLVFGDDRRLRIVDLGLARLLGALDWADPATVAAHVARYSSPEQALGQPLDGRSDVYSLTLVLTEAVTGAVPFAARSTVATLSARIGRLMPVSADLGPLAAVFEQAGRPEAADRSTAAELGRALVGAAGKLPRPAPIPLLSGPRPGHDTAQMRRPHDPTGGMTRPPDGGAVDVATTTTATPPADTEAAGPRDDEPPPAGDALPPPPPGASSRPAPPPAGPGGAAAPSARTVDDAPGGVALAVDDRPPADVTEPTEITAAADIAAPAEITAPADSTAPADDTAPADADATRPARPWLVWLGGAAALAALAVVVIVAALLLRVPRHEVPALAGLDEATARAQVEGFDWQVDVERERSDEQPEVGAIIRTVPEAGADLAEGEPFLLVVSEGPELRTLPDLTGRALSDAETELAELRLRALPAVEQPHEDIAAGDVISLSVPADPTLGPGGQVLPDTEVALVVSTGPAPRVVPELVGVPVADARATLTAMRLEVDLDEAVFSDDIPARAVVRVTPDEGTELARGDTVTLVPSKGPDLVVMPDLTGMTLTEARVALAEAGLSVGSLLGFTGGQFESASVAGEAVSAGDQVRRGAAVDLVFF